MVPPRLSVSDEAVTVYGDSRVVRNDYQETVSKEVYPEELIMLV